MSSQPARGPWGIAWRFVLALLVGALSWVEREVAEAIARGLSNAEIAAELYMSLATVKAHVGRILTKLGVDNRVQIALAVRG